MYMKMSDGNYKQMEEYDDNKARETDNDENIEHELRLTIQEIDIMECKELSKHILKSIDKDEEELSKMWEKYKNKKKIRKLLKQHFERAIVLAEQITEETGVSLFLVQRIE